MKNLIQSINQFISLTKAEEKEVIAKFNTETFSKNEFILKHGQYCSKIYFINKGKLRIFYLDDKGDEVTCFFANENEFISSYSSFLTHTPSKENLQAIQDCELLSITKTQMEQLSVDVPKIHQFRRMIAENLFIAMERRVAMLQSQSAQEAYENILKENPELILNIPQQYLASFLGITPQHLSRIRKNTTY
ncbi:MAG TPA: Crp/Fnr family transcriptional regulator [Chitinophagaceae bacterium]|nr:Crp/Fnr family transcriptional regulator [Chitinophagaceae bacterium]